MKNLKKLFLLPFFIFSLASELYAEQSKWAVHLHALVTPENLRSSGVKEWSSFVDFIAQLEAGQNRFVAADQKEKLKEAAELAFLATQEACKNISNADFVGVIQIKKITFQKLSMLLRLAINANSTQIQFVAQARENLKFAEKVLLQQAFFSRCKYLGFKYGHLAKNVAQAVIFGALASGAILLVKDRQKIANWLDAKVDKVVDDTRTHVLGAPGEMQRKLDARLDALETLVREQIGQTLVPGVLGQITQLRSEVMRLAGTEIGTVRTDALRRVDALQTQILALIPSRVEMLTTAPSVAAAAMAGRALPGRTLEQVFVQLQALTAELVARRNSARGSHARQQTYNTRSIRVAIPGAGDGASSESVRSGSRENDRVLDQTSLLFSSGELYFGSESDEDDATSDSSQSTSRASQETPSRLNAAVASNS